MASSEHFLAAFPEVVDGPFAGWRIWFASPFDTHTGPFYWRPEEHGSVTGAWIPEDKNINDVGTVHGGALMTFADAVTGVETLFATDGRAVAVTVAFNSEFMGAGVANVPVYGTACVLRETKSMVFVQGQLQQNDQPILAFSSTAKKISQH